MAGFKTNDCGLLRARGIYSDNGAGVFEFGPYLRVEYNATNVRWELLDAEVPSSPDVLYFCEGGDSVNFPLSGWETFSGYDPAPSWESTEVAAPPTPTLTPQSENSAQGTAVTWDSGWSALYFCYLQKSYFGNAAYHSIAPRIPIASGENWEIQGLTRNLLYRGQFVAVGDDGTEVIGDAVDFMATPLNRTRLEIRPSVPYDQWFLRGGPLSGIRYEIKGSGTAAGFSEVLPKNWGDGFIRSDGGGPHACELPEPDGDYCVHVILRDADGITERGGGQFIFKPQGMTPTESTTFEPLFIAEESGLDVDGERVFYDSHYRIGGIYDCVNFYWEYRPQRPALFC